MHTDAYRVTYNLSVAIESTICFHRDQTAEWCVARKMKYQSIKPKTQISFVSNTTCRSISYIKLFQFRNNFSYSLYRLNRIIFEYNQIRVSLVINKSVQDEDKWNVKASCCIRSIKWQLFDSPTIK